MKNQKKNRKTLILDCTIRDGGLINNFEFSINFVNNYLSFLEKSKCDYSELGYIQEEKYNSENDNLWKNIDISNLSKIIKKNRVKIAVMGDWGKFSLNQIPKKDDEICVDLIRVVGLPGKLEEILNCLEAISKKGYETSLNLMASSHYSIEDWETIITKINDNDFKPTFVYLMPNDIERITKKLLEIKKSKIGYHGHNQQQLAYANAIKSIESGVSIVDASVAGMGKGSGNLPTELIFNYLGIPLYHINSFVEEHMNYYIDNYEWGYLHKYLMCGIHNATSRYGEYIMRRSHSKLNDILDELSGKSLNEKLSFPKNTNSHKKITAIIPIKLNNERLPGKNLKTLNGKPLCDYIFTTMLTVKKQYKNLDIFVYCSDEKIKNYIPEGINFLKRPDYLDGNEKNYTDIFSEFIKQIDSDIFVYTHATSPFIKPESIAKGIQKVLVEGYDSCCTVVEKKSFCWINKSISNYDIRKIPRTQELKPVYIETGGFYIYNKEVFNFNNSRISNNNYFLCVDEKESIDIDNKKDFMDAEKYF